jgi:uroporphyrinogen-III synthase
LRSKTKNTILWTRSCEDWSSDKRLLQEQGLHVSHTPCLQTHRISDSPSLTDFDKYNSKVFIFTSERAALYAMQSMGDSLSQARIFCFGERSKKILEDGGFKVESLEGIRTASEIPSCLREKNISHDAFFLLPGPKMRAFDLEGALREDGFSCASINLYETRSVFLIYDEVSNFYRLPNEDEKNHFIESWEGIVFFASPSACIGFVESLHPHLNRLSQSLSVLALGPTTAEYAGAYFSRVSCARKNSIVSVIEELKKKQTRME